MELLQMSAALSGLACLLMALFSFKHLLKASLCSCGKNKQL